MTRVQRLLAVSTHAFLYLLPAATAVSGYVRVVSVGFPIEAMDPLGLPTLLPYCPIPPTA
jgi:cytochrome b561